MKKDVSLGEFLGVHDSLRATKYKATVQLPPLFAEAADFARTFFLTRFALGGMVVGTAMTVFGHFIANHKSVIFEIIFINDAFWLSINCNSLCGFFCLV